MHERVTATVKASTPRGEPTTTDVGATEMSAAAMETTTAAAMETAASAAMETAASAAAVETTASAPVSATTTTVSRHRIGCHAHGTNGDACEQHESDFGGFGDGTK